MQNGLNNSGASVSVDGHIISGDEWQTRKLVSRSVGNIKLINTVAL